jgi:hypothetical protein
MSVPQCKTDLYPGGKFITATYPTLPFETSPAFDTYYESLKQGVEPIIPSVPLDISKAVVEAYMKADMSMIIQLDSEYTYYYTNYKCRLERYLTAPAAEKATLLPNVNLLNNRVLTLLRVYEKLVYEKSTVNNIGMNLVIKDSVADIRAKAANLKTQAKLLETGDDEKLYTKMMEYAKEKARMNDSLLNLYAFLNIVGIGIMFYIYRST